MKMNYRIYVVDHGFVTADRQFSKESEDAKNFTLYKDAVKFWAQFAPLHYREPDDDTIANNILFVRAQ